MCAYLPQVVHDSCTGQFIIRPVSLTWSYLTCAFESNWGTTLLNHHWLFSGIIAGSCIYFLVVLLKLVLSSSASQNIWEDEETVLIFWFSETTGFYRTEVEVPPHPTTLHWIDGSSIKELSFNAISYQGWIISNLVVACSTVGSPCLLSLPFYCVCKSLDIKNEWLSYSDY